MNEYAYPTDRDDTAFGSFRATVLRTPLPIRPGALLAGTILAPGKRTVASALRAAGLEEERRFCRYHRVLNRAVWSSREASRVLLRLLVEAFVPGGEPLVVGIDETLERRQGKKIVAKGIYRDPVRSSHNNFVKTSALRWVCLTLLAPMHWASRIWALPFLSALAPSQRYTIEREESDTRSLPSGPGNYSCRLGAGIHSARS